MNIFDPLSATMLADPYPIYAHLRSADPMHWSELLQGWVLTRFADCAEVLQETTRFSSDFRTIGEDIPAEILSLQTVDPPTHTALRRPILHALRSADMSGWVADTVSHAEKRLTELDMDGFDFVTEFAEPLAAASMCSLFGVPLDEDPVAFRAAQRDLVLSMDSGLAPERRSAGLAARRYLSDLVDPACDGTSRAGGLLSRIDFRGAGEELPRLVNSVRTIFVAGYSSAGSMLVNAMYALAAGGRLDQREPVAVDATAFNELVRFEGAVQAVSRAVIADAELPSGPVRAGDIAVAVIGAANRDPRVFQCPDELWLDRTDNLHLGFGRGTHACIGTRLAMRLSTAVLTTLSRGYRIAPAGEPVRRPTATIRSLDALPLSLRPR